MVETAEVTFSPAGSLKRVSACSRRHALVPDEQTQWHANWHQRLSDMFQSQASLILSVADAADVLTDEQRAQYYAVRAEVEEY